MGGGWKLDSWKFPVWMLEGGRQAAAPRFDGRTINNKTARTTENKKTLGAETKEVGAEQRTNEGGPYLTVILF